MLKSQMKLLVALLLIAGAANVFAGGTVRNSAEDGDARRRALQAWNSQGTKSAAKRATAKPKKGSALIEQAVNNETERELKRAKKVAAAAALATQNK